MRWWAILCCAHTLGGAYLVGCDAGTSGTSARSAPAVTGRVLDALTGAPVARARVLIIGTTRATETDGTGAFALVGPAGFNRARVTATGYLGGELVLDDDRPLRLWPTAASERLIRSHLAARARPPRDGDDPGDPDLTPRARAYLLGGRQTPRLAPGALGVARHALVVPPDTVRVYRRGAENDSCQGRVDVMPLEEYVRGVVPHEWIPSWHLESLKAGAVAARTYAWNWVERGGKYDCADVDDTARSQVYRDDRNDRADEAVEATAGQGVIRDGAIISAEYSAENGDPTAFGVSEPLCTGRARQGHGRGMCQWGTQRWATQRDKGYAWMVEHYYPGATVSRPEPPGPRLELSQGLSRPRPQPCADPAGTYDCADFMPGGRSWGLFDLYMGETMELALRVKNAGGGPTAEEGDRSAVTLAVELPEGLLSAVALRIETDAPAHDGRTFSPHPAGDDPNNPPADAPGGPSLRVRLHGLAAGETRRVILTLRGVGYSVPTGAPARVRTFIASMADYYEKPAWDQPPAQNEGQTFNGGDLRLLTEIDVYDPARWTFDGGDSELLEGWRGRGGVGPLSVDPDSGTLRITVNGADPGLVSPFTRIDADRLGQLRVATGAAVEGRVFWRAPGEDFAEQRSTEATFGAEPVLLAGTPGWAGDVEQIRLDLAEGAGDVAIDSIALEPYRQPPPDRDAATPGPDAAGPRHDARPARDAQSRPSEDAGLGDGRAPPADPPGVIAGASGSPAHLTEVRHDGGCRTAPSTPISPWLALLLLPVRPRHHSR